MTARPERDPQAARLLKALEQRSDLTCEQAQALLPALVEAELSGADADDLPQFAALLRHLDTCEADCVALYADLSAKMSAVLEEREGIAAAEAPVSAARPLQKVREVGQVALSLLRDVANGFRLELPLPRLASAGTLGTLDTERVFDETLTELDAQPQVMVVLGSSAAQRDLLVTVQAPDGPEHWQVDLTLGELSHSATTGAGGLARFTGLPLAEDQRLVLTITPLVRGSAAEAEG